MARTVLRIEMKVTWRAKVVLFYANLLLALGVDIDIDKVAEIFFSHCKITMR